MTTIYISISLTSPSSTSPSVSCRGEAGRSSPVSSLQTPMPRLPFYAPLACTSRLLWSGVENHLLRSFGCLLIFLVLELLRNVPLQETLNAPYFSYKVCMHAPSPVKQTNKVSLLLFSPSMAPLDPPSLLSPPLSVYRSSHVSSISSYTPISHMP